MHTTVSVLHYSCCIATGFHLLYPAVNVFTLNATLVVSLVSSEPRGMKDSTRRSRNFCAV